MDNRAEVRDFLLSPRAKITRQQVGLPDVGARWVPSCGDARLPTADHPSARSADHR